MEELGDTVAKKLFNFQEDTVNVLLDNPKKHIVVAEVGLGKGAISVSWAKGLCKRENKHKVLVITTASKVHVKDKLKRNDFEQDADEFCGEDFRLTTKFETVSWDMLYRWVDEHRRELGEWVYIADEIFKAKTSTSRRGKAFQKIAQSTTHWTGYTATPGDKYIDLEAYFQACGLVRNVTHFKRQFCIIQTFKGFPEIVGYLEEPTLKRWWAEISYAPDTQKALQELPKATYKVVDLPKPKGYEKVLKMRQKLCKDGTLSEDYEDFLDNPSKTAHYLRQLCFTKEKQQWLSDFLEGLGENCIVFYNYRETGDTIEQLALKALPKGAKVWRIDGSHHEIPTKETVGKYDIVLAQWQSGAEGLNVQYARVWIAAEMTYSYTTHHQGKGRVMRIGQTRPVFYYLLKTQKTIEDDILKCIQEKRDFAENVWLLGNGLIKEKDEH